MNRITSASRQIDRHSVRCRSSHGSNRSRSVSSTDTHATVARRCDNGRASGLGATPQPASSGECSRARQSQYLHRMTVDELERAVRLSWSRLTAEHPARWTPENPAYLQCSATSRLVREFLGGDILIAPVTRAGVACGFHAWNRLPDGTEADLTREQFRADEVIGEPAAREPVRGFLASALLRARVERHLAHLTDLA